MGVYEPDCDDVTEDGICLGDMVYCDENRRRCETADDFYHKTEGGRYYRRFQVMYRNRADEYELRDEHNKLKRLRFKEKDDAHQLYLFLNENEWYIKDLQEIIEPLENVCEKYNIDLKDLPATLEEYIERDNK